MLICNTIIVITDCCIYPGRVFTAEYDLDHIQDAYEAMDQRKVIKALIRF